MRAKKSTLIVKVCPVCGNEFRHSRGDPDRKHCSKKCMGEARRREGNLRRTRQCLACGKDFIRSKYRPNQKCCSVECGNVVGTDSRKKRAMKASRICVQCGTEYTPTTHLQRYCGVHCRRKAGGKTQGKDFVSATTYREMLDRQGGVCAICKKTDPDRKLAVDHNHATDEIRMLLCRQCNTGLGSFRDDPALLRLAAEYLEQFTPSR